MTRLINKCRNKHIPALIIFVTFYLFFAFEKGAVVCADTMSYINMDISREPVYCILLAVFRGVFGSDGSTAQIAATMSGTARTYELYLCAVEVFQSLVTALCTWSLYAYLTDTYLNEDLDKKGTLVQTVVKAILLAIPLGVSCLNLFFAGRASMYSNGILTEALAIPLFLLFFRFLMEYVNSNGKTALVICVILSTVMISTRKQMFITLGLLVIAVFVKVNAGEKKQIKKVLKKLFMAGLTALIILTSVKLIDYSYNRVTRGAWVTHSSDVRFLTTVAFYVADREDYKHLGDENLEELFLDIYDTCDEKEYMASHAGKGWKNRVMHYIANYDHIQLDTMWRKIDAYVINSSEKSGLNEDYVNSAELTTSADAIMRRFNSAIIPYHIPEIIRCFADEFVEGIVLTAAKNGTIFEIFALIVFALLIAGLATYLIDIKKAGRKSAPLSETDHKFANLGIFVLLAILLNITLVSAVIFCQTRYTIYNMPLLYMTLVLMLYDRMKRICQPETGAEKYAEPDCDI